MFSDDIICVVASFLSGCLITHYFMSRDKDFFYCQLRNFHSDDLLGESKKYIEVDMKKRTGIVKERCFSSNVYPESDKFRDLYLGEEINFLALFRLGNNYYGSYLHDNEVQYVLIEGTYTKKKLGLKIGNKKYKIQINK